MCFRGGGLDAIHALDRVLLDRYRHGRDLAKLVVLAIEGGWRGMLLLGVDRAVRLAVGRCRHGVN